MSLGTLPLGVSPLGTEFKGDPTTVSKSIGIAYSISTGVSRNLTILFSSRERVVRNRAILWGTLGSVSNTCDIVFDNLIYAVNTNTIIYSTTGNNSGLNRKNNQFCIEPENREVQVPILNEECACEPPPLSELY